VPIYEYRCEQCGVTFEKFYRSAAMAGEALCPSCGRPGRRLLSLFSRPRGAQPGPGESEREGTGGEHGHCTAITTKLGLGGRRRDRRHHGCSGT
jgi:putative FmdB family regulatory protein